MGVAPAVHGSEVPICMMVKTIYTIAGISSGFHNPVSTNPVEACDAPLTCSERYPCTYATDQTRKNRMSSGSLNDWKGAREFTCFGKTWPRLLALHVLKFDGQGCGSCPFHREPHLKIEASESFKRGTRVVAIVLCKCHCEK